MGNNKKVPFILELTPESMIQSLKEDPRVISVKFENGTFYIETAEGSFSFKLKHPMKGAGHV